MGFSWSRWGTFRRKSSQKLPKSRGLVSCLSLFSCLFTFFFSSVHQSKWIVPILIVFRWIWNEILIKNIGTLFSYQRMNLMRVVLLFRGRWGEMCHPTDPYNSGAKCTGCTLILSPVGKHDRQGVSGSVFITASLLSPWRDLTRFWKAL